MYITWNSKKSERNGEEQGRFQRFWKGVALYFGHHGWPAKKMLGFRWSKKAKITLGCMSFFNKIFLNISNISKFSLFTSSESLPNKSYQFFKVWKCFDKEREKTLIQQLMRKEKLRKVRLCFKNWEKLRFVL